MMMDAMRINYGYSSEGLCVIKKPNIDATKFFELLKDFDESLWDECTSHNKLSVIAQVFTIKSVYRLSEIDYDNIIKWVKNILLKGNRLKKNFYVVKFMIKPTGLGYKKFICA
jgi:hypothetical protein